MTATIVPMSKPLIRVITIESELLGAKSNFILILHNYTHEFSNEWHNQVQKHMIHRRNMQSTRKNEHDCILASTQLNKVGAHFQPGLRFIESISRIIGFFALARGPLRFLP
jgi:hypothetical protein